MLLPLMLLLKMLVLLTNFKFRVFSFYLSWCQIQSIFCVIWCLVSMLVSGYYAMLRKHSRFRGKEEYIAELSKVHAKQISYQCFLTSIFPEDIFIKTLLSILSGGGHWILVTSSEFLFVILFGSIFYVYFILFF